MPDPTPREAMRDLWEAVVVESRLDKLLYWMDRQLRRLPRFYAWLERH